MKYCSLFIRYIDNIQLFAYIKNLTNIAYNNTCHYSQAFNVTKFTHTMGSKYPPELLKSRFCFSVLKLLTVAI